jgi:hypothetical protein
MWINFNNSNKLKLYWNVLLYKRTENLLAYISSEHIINFLSTYFRKEDINSRLLAYIPTFNNVKGVQLSN